MQLHYKGLFDEVDERMVCCLRNGIDFVVPPNSQFLQVHPQSTETCTVYSTVIRWMATHTKPLTPKGLQESQRRSSKEKESRINRSFLVSGMKTAANSWRSPPRQGLGDIT